MAVDTSTEQVPDARPTKTVSETLQVFGVNTLRLSKVPEVDLKTSVIRILCPAVMAETDWDTVSFAGLKMSTPFRSGSSRETGETAQLFLATAVNPILVEVLLGGLISSVVGELPLSEVHGVQTLQDLEAESQIV